MTERGAESTIPVMEPTLKDAIPAIETTWVVVAAVLVMLMQVGFLFLEVGFSRMKNVGTIVPKVLANFSIAAVCYWAVGFALAFDTQRLDIEILGELHHFVGDRLHVAGAPLDDHRQRERLHPRVSPSQVQAVQRRQADAVRDGRRPGVREL